MRLKLMTIALFMRYDSTEHPTSAFASRKRYIREIHKFPHCVCDRLGEFGSAMAHSRRFTMPNTIGPYRNVSSTGSSASANNNEWSTEDLIKASRQLPIRLEELEQENKRYV